MNGICIVKRTATVDEYSDMRKSAGWGCYNEEVLTKSLMNTLFSVCAEKDGKIVGYGRLIGDSGFTFYIQDIIVKPEFQGLGIGKKIAGEIIEHVRNNYTDGAMLCLMAAKGKEAFYTKLGFTERPDEKYGAGMIQYIYK